MDTESLHFEYFEQGPFMACLLVDSNAGRPFVGVAMCGPKDKPAAAIGRVIAEGRAMNARAEHYAKVAYAR